MYIIDFEASSLGRNSYPIEVAWGKCRNTVWTSLINPSVMHDWNDWDIRSQRIHGIDRELLLKNGQNPQIVAKKMIDCLAGKRVYSDEPYYDSMWKDRLLRDSGFDPHSIKIQDLKAYMARLTKCSLHQRKFSDYLRSFTSGNQIQHRAKEDVIWLFDFLEYLQSFSA